MNPISVVLIEDHDVVRIGIRTALQQQAGIEVVGEAASGFQGLQVLEKVQPDVALIDVGLPGVDGIELTRRFRAFQAEQPNCTTKILILTMQGNDDVVLAAFAAGADSYCMKNIEIERLKEAVEATHQGSAWIDPAIANVVLRQLKQDTTEADSAMNRKTVSIAAVEPEYEQLLTDYPLTGREREVLECIVSGCSNIEIAEKLYITVGTVKTHVRNILEKLCANDRTEAAVRALRSGIIS
jgi:two-component system, NarL family, response regulator LiaR